MAVSPSSIDVSEFKDALSRYPDVLAAYSNSKTSDSLQDLDKFRYQTAPSSFSKSTGRVMELSDVKKLLEWKMKHGTFRPNLGKLVASNTDAKVAAATKDAFSYYETHPNDIKGVLEKLATPLKGIGPATASLLLAVHDPALIIYFSDELYRWLLFDGKKATPKYTAKEFEQMYSKANDFMDRLNCTPIELEQVAFVVIKEMEPVQVAAPPYVPSGLPRGRPAKPESEKKSPYVPTGKPRGRRPDPNRVTKTPAKKEKATLTPKTKPAPKPAAKATTEVKEETSEPKKRGRPAKAKEDAPSTATEIKKRGRPSLKSAVDPPAPTPPASKKRGRPSMASVAAAGDASSPAKKRGRPSLAASTVATPASKKRGRPSLAAAATPAPDSVSTPATKKRGRPSLASLAAEGASTTTPRSKKRGRPSMAESSNKKTKL